MNPGTCQWHDRHTDLDCSSAAAVQVLVPTVLGGQARVALCRKHKAIFDSVQAGLRVSQKGGAR